MFRLLFEARVEVVFFLSTVACKGRGGVEGVPEKPRSKLLHIFFSPIRIVCIKHVSFVVSCIENGVVVTLFQ